MKLLLFIIVIIPCPLSYFWLLYTAIRRNKIDLKWELCFLHPVRLVWLFSSDRSGIFVAGEKKCENGWLVGYHTFKSVEKEKLAFASFR